MADCIGEFAFAKFSSQSCNKLRHKEDGMNQDYDDSVLDCFLEKQEQLFPEPVAESREEAAYFLEDCMAVVAKNAGEVLAYFEEVGADISGETTESILEAAEVFEVGDGRYLIVEG